MNEARRREELQHIPGWQWVIAALGAALVITVVSYLLRQELVAGAAPPDIAVRAAGIVVLENGYLVELQVRNTGDEAASSVEIEGELRDERGPVQTSTATLQYLPGRSERQAGLFFTEDPRRQRLQLRATGYERP